MKKVLFALAFAALMLPASLRAQVSAPWSEGFETEASLSSWTLTPDYRTSGADTGFVYLGSFGYLTPGCIYSYGPGSATSPAITLPADATGLSLVYYIYKDAPYQAQGYTDVYTIELIVDGTTSIELENDEIAPTDDFEHAIFSLDTLGGHTVAVKFTFLEIWPASLFAIDDIKIDYTNEPVYEISVPSSAFIGETYPLKAVHIEGVETNVTFAWTSAMGTIANPTADSTTITYANGGVDTITLTVTNDYGTFITETYVAAINWSDIVAGCETPVEEFPYDQDFEDQYNFDCVKIYDADGDGNNWQIGGGKVHSGSNCATSASYVSGTVLTPDNWLIMPPFVLPNDVTGFVLSWWDIAQDSNWIHENYSVYVTTDPNTFGTNPVYNGEPGEHYAKHSVSLENFAGQTIYVAFRHHNCTDNFRLNIDDIHVGNTLGIENAENEANVAIYPNPVRNMLNIEGNNVKNVEVIDMDGRVVLTNDRAGQIDMSNLSDGVYMVRVMSENGVSTKKIVKK